MQKIIFKKGNQRVGFNITTEEKLANREQA